MISRRQIISRSAGPIFAIFINLFIFYLTFVNAQASFDTFISAPTKITEMPQRRRIMFEDSRGDAFIVVAQRLRRNVIYSL